MSLLAWGPGPFSVLTSLWYLKYRATIIRFDDRIQVMISITVWDGKLKDLNPKSDQKNKIRMRIFIGLFLRQVRNISG